jgi:hypothetical protein
MNFKTIYEIAMFGKTQTPMKINGSIELIMSFKKIFKYELNTIGWFGFIITLIILIMYCKFNHFK